MLHVGDKTGRIYKGYRTPTKVIKDGVALQDYEHTTISGESSTKFLSYYNTFLPSFGIEGNSVLDGETHTFNNFGGEFNIVNSGKNLLKINPVNGATYGFNGYGTVLVYPCKAGETYRISFRGLDTSKPFATYIRLGVSKNRTKYITYDVIKPFFSNFSYTNYIYITDGTKVIKSSANLVCVQDCYLVIYESNGIEPCLARYTQIQLEMGSTTTDFEPYREPQTISVDLQSDFSFSPCSLRKVNNVADELTIGEFTEENAQINGTQHGAIYKKRIGYIASYNGEDVGTQWITSSGTLTVGEPVEYVLPQQTLYVDNSFNKKVQQVYKTNTLSIGSVSTNIAPSLIKTSYIQPL